MIEIDLEQIGARIKLLRGRLTQAAFADRLGLERKTVGRYESGERAPDALALARLMAEFDADPAWVLTGGGFVPAGTDDERELLALFRAAPLAVKAAAVGALQGGSATPAAKVKKQIKVSAAGGHAAGHDMVVNPGKARK